MKKDVEEKMQMELQLTDIIDRQNIIGQTIKLKMNKIKKYAIWMEKWLQYTLGAIVVLLAITITMYGLFRCVK